MERLHKRTLLVLALVLLGVIVNYLSIPLLIKSDYVFEKAVILTIIYIAGILCGAIAIKIINNYISDEDTKESMVCNRYMEQFSLQNMLTNLPNRIALEKRFELILEQTCDKNFKILFIDVDGFKIVNDTLGHAVGDEVLKKIANRLTEIIDGQGELFHIRGDEFVLLLSKNESIEDICHMAKRIIKSMAIPFVFKERELHLTVSIGIATYPWDGYNVNLLLQSAHLAVQRAKESGKNNFKVYDHSMNLKMNKKLDLINNLHRAVEKEEFVLYYQPQVNSLTGEVVGLEALIRWESPDMGIISPAEFIPLAEETGLIIPIGDWVLKAACTQNKAWQNLGYASLPVSVNISALQFQESSFVDKVVKVLKDTELDPRWLHLEITESIAIKDTELTIDILNRLKDIGLKIALDDFGTGFSSLGYLKKFKINVLKIDSSFIRDIGEEDATITKTIIVLGKSLNMEVIAEGVETKEQFNYLKEVGCDKVQGYLFSRPVPPAEIEKMLYIA